MTSQTTTATTAENVARTMGDDGTQFKAAADGRTLDQVCRGAGASVERGTGDRTNSVRYEFADGSAIVDAEGTAWDIQGSAPWSWAGAE